MSYRNRGSRPARPHHVELPQVPACEPCNRKWGDLESALRERLGFAIDPYHSGGEGIGEKSLWAIDPSKAKNPRDAEKRLRSQERFRRRIKHVAELPADEPLLPNIGRIASEVDGEWLVDAIEAKTIADVVKKWVTGLTYFFTKHYIDPHVYVVQASQVGQAVPTWLRTGGLSERLAIGPGMIIERRYASDDPIVGFWAFSVWDGSNFSERSFRSISSWRKRHRSSCCKTPAPGAQLRGKAAPAAAPTPAP